MTRIIAGSVGGRTIAVPARGTRPTSDRVRESLFAILEADGVLPGARVLDLYAGSGALGLEAASRGAAQVDLVERDHQAARVCRANTAALGLAGVLVHEAPVEAYLARTATRASADGGVNLAFVDPPYELGENELTRALTRLEEHLAPGALVVVERSARSPEPTAPTGLATWRIRKHGETVLYLLEAAGSE